MRSIAIDGICCIRPKRPVCRTLQKFCSTALAPLSPPATTFATCRIRSVNGYGRSDGREALRAHFEVDRRFIVLATLRALADEGVVPRSLLAEAISALGIDVNKPNPLNS